MQRGSPDMPFVILGGGPCGLAAAWQLTALGHKPIVLEAEPRVGGLCATHAFEVDGGTYRFDLGGHRFVSSDAALSRWLHARLGDDLIEKERKSVVLHEGRRFRYPLEPIDLVQKLGVVENARALVGYAKARAAARIRPTSDVSFEDWVVARFGRPLYDTFFGPYTEKLWGLAPSQISADWAQERISLLGLGDALLRLFALRRTPTRTYARRYLYPRFGMGQLYETIAREITLRGGVVRTGARVEGLEIARDRGESRVTAVRVRSASGYERVPVGELLSTGALPDLVRWLAPARNAALDGAIERMRFRALTFLNMPLARPDFSENTWMYVASRGVPISRVQEPKRRSEAMAPSGRTSVMLEIPCDAGDATFRASAGELRASMSAHMRAIGLPVDDALAAFDVRVAHGYPVYHLGYERDRSALLVEVNRFANVRTAGRQGLFRYIFMDAAMQMGMRAAMQMARGERGGAGIDAIGRASSVIESRALTA